MKKVFLPLFCLFFVAYVAEAQTVTWSTPGCGTSNPNLQMVVFQGCTPSEGTKEFVHFTTGTSSWNVSDLTITGSQNSTISPFSPCSLSPGDFSGNISVENALNAIAGCSPAPFAAGPMTIPPNSKVLIVPNAAGAFSPIPYQNITAAQLAPLCGKGPIYVIATTAKPGCTQGVFANINPACPTNCNRNIIINFGGGCVATINYDINDSAMPSSTATGVNFTPNNNGTAAVNVPNTCFPSPYACTIPTATASNTISPSVLCVGATNQTINLSVATNALSPTYAWSGPNSFTSTQQNPTINNAALPLGTHTYTVTVTDVGGCTKTSTTSVTITQGSNISTNITGSNTICPNSSAVLSASGNFSTYKWNTGETSASITISSGGLYVVTVGDGSGCNATASKSVSILNTPNPVISGATSICQGASTTLAVNGAYNAYQWSNGSNNQTIIVNTAGQYNVTVTDSNGCKGVASVNITSSGTLNVAITGNPNFCTGKSTMLSAGEGFSTYLWDSGETTSSITTTTSGIHSVTVSNGLCIGTASVIVNQVANPIVTIIGDKQFCKGGATTLSIVGNNSAYLWSNGATTPSITVSNAGFYSPTVTNSNGCTGTSSIAVSEYATPTATINGPSTLCGTMANTTLSLNQVYSSYLWSNSSISSISTISGAGTYSVTVTDANGCTAVATKTITQSGSLSPKFVNNTNVICGNTTTTLTLDEPYATYQWNTGQTSATLVATTGGTYAVTVTNASGCTGIVATVVQQFPAFSIAINGSDKICSGKETMLNAGSNAGIYLWSNGEHKPIINVSTPGTYTVTVTNPNGCTAVASKTLTLAANALTTFKNVICEGDKFNFSNQSLTKSGIYTAIFTAANSCDSTVVLTLDVLPIDTVRLQKTLCSGVAGTFVNVLKQQNGCDSVIITTVKIATKLNVVINEQNKVLTLNTALSGVMYQWLLNGKAIVGANSAAFTAFVDGLYCVEITDVNGCTHKSNTIQIGQVTTSDITQSNIRIYPNPTTGLCRIEGDDDFVKNALLVNLLGQKHFLQIIDNQIDISIFPNGIYQLLLQNKEGKSFCAKLIKQ